ncbi:unnamed protein product, partial [marine sediment metagenome]
RASGYDQVFADDEMLFYTGVDDLAAGIERVLGAGEPWREMARAGRQKAIATMSETVVAKFMVDMIVGTSPPSDWAFTDHVFTAGRQAAEPAGE